MFDMSTASNQPLISVEEYLRGEAVARLKHEYVAGMVYAMVGASNAHNRIATNGTVSLGSQLRGNACRVFNSDTKIRVRSLSNVRFYYPDFSVICQSNADSDTYQDNPVLVAEVISDSTRRADEQEKRDAYLSIHSLKVYLLIEQSKAAIIAYRRVANGFEREIYEGIQAVVPLSEIGCTLSLKEIYEGVDLTPRMVREEISV